MFLWFTYSLLSSLKNRNYFRFVLYLFVTNYLILLFLRSVPYLKSEVNTRTILYVLIFLQLDMGIFLVNALKKLSTKKTKYIIKNLLVIFLLGGFILIQTFRFSRICFEYNLNMHNISDLADARFKIKTSELLSRMFEVLNINKLTIYNVVTNKEKILGTYTKDYKELMEIPSSIVFNGNHDIVNKSVFDFQKKQMDSLFLTGKKIIIVFNPRTKVLNHLENEYIKSLNKNDYKIEYFKEGYLAYASNIITHSY